MQILFRNSTNDVQAEMTLFFSVAATRAQAAARIGNRNRTVPVSRRKRYGQNTGLQSCETVRK